MSDVVLIGGGGHASSVLDALPAGWGHRLIGYVAPAAGLTASLALEYLGTDDEAEAIARRGCRLAISGVGGARSNALRQKLFDRWQRHGFQFVTIVHPSAAVSRRAEIGAGSVCLAQSAVGPGSRLGVNVIVNTSASIDHDCVIGDHVHVAPGVTLCGTVRVGAGAFIGAGATVVPGVTIGAGATVGAGSTVVKDVAAGQMVMGVPARPRPAGEE